MSSKNVLYAGSSVYHRVNDISVMEGAIVTLCGLRLMPGLPPVAEVSPNGHIREVCKKCERCYQRVMALRALTDLGVW